MFAGGDLQDGGLRAERVDHDRQVWVPQREAHLRPVLHEQPTALLHSANWRAHRFSSFDAHTDVADRAAVVVVVVDLVGEIDDLALRPDLLTQLDEEDLRIFRCSASTTRLTLTDALLSTSKMRRVCMT